MATSSDSKVIERDSSKIGLADRYRLEKSGGAFDSKKDVKTSGSNEKSIGTSASDVTYTNTKGFKIKMQQGQTELKDAQGTSSKQLSRYLKGFNNKKYTNGSFTR